MRYKEIKDFPNYYIYEDGRIYSKWKKDFVKPWLASKGRYLMIKLSKDGKLYHKQIHRLVAEHFVPNPHNHPEVNHIDYDTTNNFYKNLEWCTRKDNMSHAFKKYSPVRNYRECYLMDGDVIVGKFQSINEACRYAHKHYGLSMSSMNKYRKVGKYKIIKEGQTTISLESTPEDKLLVEVPTSLAS